MRQGRAREPGVAPRRRRSPQRQRALTTRTIYMPRWACVALFVARLSAPYREAITLTELQGLTQKDAAEMLGISLSGMKSRVQRGREKIREMFHQVCQVSVDCRGRVTGCEPRAAELLPEDCRETAAEWSARRGGCH